MPTLTLLDIQKIETAAKCIFNSSRTMADVTSATNIEQFSHIFSLCDSIPEYNHPAYSRADKIYLIFYLYVASDATEGATLEKDFNAYKSKQLPYLRNQAVIMEAQLHNITEMPRNIASYARTLVIIEHINKLIIRKEKRELNAIDDFEDFGEMVSQYEKCMNLLNNEQAIASDHFGVLNQRKSVYLNTCATLLEIATQVLYKKICDHVATLNGRIMQKLKLGLNDNVITKAAQLESMRMDFMLYITDVNLSPTVKNIYKVVCTYMGVCRLIYLARYSYTKDVAENAFNIYSKVNQLILTTDERILDILKIEDKCCYIASKLFSPLMFGGVRQTQDTSNQDRCRSGVANKGSPEAIIQQFRLPLRTQNTTCLWDSVKPGDNVADIRKYLDTISFFQDYVSPERLAYVLKIKYKVQMRYVSLLNNNEFNDYHNTMVLDLVGRCCISHLYPHTALIQEYDAKLIEHLVYEQECRRGLRICMRPY